VIADAAATGFVFGNVPDKSINEDGEGFGHGLFHSPCDSAEMSAASEGELRGVAHPDYFTDIFFVICGRDHGSSSAKYL
jgi:hypothetical protein